MAISYLSTPVQPTPYVPDIDLNVMSRVLSYKQGQFDQNSLKIQNSINSLASLDVMRGVDRDYLNQKVNGLVQNLNGLGGIDLSDPNVSGQVEGIASSLYTDGNILNAASSTKRIRSLTADYDKYRTDPKLMKYWSESNYVNDMENVNSYANDKTLGASYNGNSAATPFEDYTNDYIKYFKDIKANKYTEISPGVYVDKNGVSQRDGFNVKTTTKTISENDIREEARQMLNPNQQAQMSRDAYYTYGYRMKGLPDDVQRSFLVNKATQTAKDNLDAYSNMIDALTAKKQQAGDVATRTAIQNQIDTASATKVKLQNQFNTSNDYYNNLYNSSPKELMYQVYSTDFFNGIAKRFAVHEQDIQKTADPYMLADYKGKISLDLQDNKEQNAEKLLSLKDKLSEGTGQQSLFPGLSPLSIVNPDNTQNDSDKARQDVFRNLGNTFTASANALADDYKNKVGSKVSDINSSYHPIFIAKRTLADAATNSQNAANSTIVAGLGDIVSNFDINNYIATRLPNMAAAGDYFKTQKGAHAITEEDINKKTPNGQYAKAVYEKIKQRIAEKEGLPRDNLELTSIYPSMYSFKKDPKTGKNVLDNDVYVTVNTKDPDTKKIVVQKIQLQDDEVSDLGLKPPNDLESAFNIAVDKDHPFTTVVQSNNNPNLVAQISIGKLNTGSYQAYYNYQGHPIPLNSQTYPTAMSAYRNAQEKVNAFKSKDDMDNVAKGYKFSVNDGNPAITFSYDTTPANQFGWEQTHNQVNPISNKNDIDWTKLSNPSSNLIHIK